MGVVIGIDPGLSGALASVDSQNQVRHIKMPVIKNGTKKVLDLPAIISWIKAHSWEPIDCVVLEHVHAMPGQGVTSTFTFGEVYGCIKGILAALEVPFVEVKPQHWQKEIFAGIPADLKKQRSVLYCSRRFPLLGKINDGVGDAICLALFGRNSVNVSAP